MDIFDTRENLNPMVLKHDQQIKDLSAHLLELKQRVTPMMEFKRSGWVGLTKEELQTIFNYEPNDIKHIAFLVESLCKEKNGG
jgi:hypothetical protein